MPERSLIPYSLLKLVIPFKFAGVILNALVLRSVHAGAIFPFADVEAL